MEKFLLSVAGVLVASFLIFVARRLRSKSRLRKAASQLLDKVTNLYDHSLYKDAITIIKNVDLNVTRDIDRDSFIRILNCQGNCYFQLAMRKQKEENLLLARSTFIEALSAYTVLDEPALVVMCSSNLATVEANLADIRNSVERLSHSIALTREVLEFLYSHGDVISLVETQTNLANMYTELSKYKNRKENLQDAIKLLKDSISNLNGRSKRVEAAAQNSLCISLRKYSDIEEPVHYLRQSIEAGLRAAELTDIDDDPMLFGFINQSLGNASLILFDETGEGSELKSAVQHLIVASKVLTIEETPRDYAATQSSLGSAYRNLSKIENCEHNLKHALDAFINAGSVFSVSSFPLHYALNEHNLANLFLEHYEHNRDPHNLEQATTSFDNALRIRTKDKYPLKHAETLVCKSTAYFHYYNHSIDAVYLDSAAELLEEAIDILQTEGDSKILDDALAKQRRIKSLLN